jgi:DNA transformation protein
MASDALVEHCLELLAPLGPVTARRMFGGHGLRVDGLFFGLIVFDRLYLKVDAATRPAFEAAGCSPFVYDGKGKQVTVSYWTVPAEAMESPAFMHPWARLALQAALTARAAAPVKKPRATPPAKQRIKPRR